MFARRRFCDRNRRQSSATIDNEVAMAVPMASSAKVVTFGGFKRRVALFHVAGVVLCDIPTFFITCRKSFCVACAILSRRFEKMSCIFHGAALWRPPSSFCVAGATLLTCRVACSWRIALSGLREMDTRNSMAGVAFCET